MTAPDPALVAAAADYMAEMHHWQSQPTHRRTAAELALSAPAVADRLTQADRYAHALAKYGGHEALCAANWIADDGELAGPCDCGWTDVADAIAAATRQGDPHE